MLAKKILKLDRKLKGKYVIKGTVVMFSDAPVGTFVEYPQEIVSLEEIEKFLESFNLAKVVRDNKSVSSQSTDQTVLTEQQTESVATTPSEPEEVEQEKTKQINSDNTEKGSSSFNKIESKTPHKSESDTSELDSSNQSAKRTKKKKNN